MITAHRPEPRPDDMQPSLSAAPGAPVDPSVPPPLLRLRQLIEDRSANVDLWDALDAAATKPFGYMPFWPGPGVGGHCIAIDPSYLYVPRTSPGEERPRLSSVELTDELMAAADCVVILTAHPSIDCDAAIRAAGLVFDAAGARSRRAENVVLL